MFSELPWGFEIYSLLTRWNPLNFERPVPREASRLQGAGGGPGSGRLHAGASPDERRPHRGGHRRLEDRAAGAGRSPGWTRSGERVPFRPIREIAELQRAVGRPRDGGLRRRGRVRDHGPLGQELPQGDPAAAGAAAANSACSAACASAAPSPSTAPSNWASITSRCARAPGKPTVISDEERSHQGRPASFGLPDGACS